MRTVQVETIPVAEIAKALKTAPMKIKSGIKNGTMPIGVVLQEPGSGVERTIIIKKRWERWIAGEI